MQRLSNHIVLIGFKQVGKSAIGKRLSEKQNLPFIDLDQQIELNDDKQMTCRQIMQDKGEKYFRHLETTTLSSVIHFAPAIIALGGGTPLCTENQNTLKTSLLIHIIASKNIVFERILKGRQPAFFNPKEDLFTSFNRLWDEREKVYTKVRNLFIENEGTVDDAVDKIVKEIEYQSS